jgi:pyruvate dehydrogenase E2 component (dihydrolipoamide acetyltransferase)
MGEIVMPRLSDTMQEGTILRWLKSDGELVRRGEEIVEIETDKAAMTYESDLEGSFKALAAEGDTLPVGATIALVGAEAQGSAGEPAGAVPAAQAPASRGTGDGPAPGGPATDGLRGAPAEATGGTRVRASPLARRVARERGVDLAGVSGSGPGGRIVRADVEGAPVATGAGSALAEGSAATAPGAPPPGAGAAAPVATAKGEARAVELNRTQQTIARRMAESRATIPDFSVEVDVDMDECVRLRAELRRLAQASAGGYEEGPLGAPTYNDMVVKAAALALREHPRANSSYRDGVLQVYSRVNVGVAVAAHGALVVPTVFDADEKSLGEIARETRLLAERVRTAAITPPELGGGTFTVSNLGMFGVRSFAPIINPPQTAILSVGALEPRPVARDGEVVIRHILTLTLVCDHRALYGADAAQLLARTRELLEAPAALTL